MRNLNFCVRSLHKSCARAHAHSLEGTLVVTAYDFESSCPGSNPEWVPIHYKALITTQGLPEPSSLRGSTLVPEQLNIKAVTGHAK